MEKVYRAKPIKGDIDMVALRKSVRSRISRSLAVLSEFDKGVGEAVTSTYRVGGPYDGINGGGPTGC